MPIRSYRDIEAYQRAKALVVPMHKLVKRFPAYEQFDLCDQIRRASKSVVANIVEGYSAEILTSNFQPPTSRGRLWPSS